VRLARRIWESFARRVAYVWEDLVQKVADIREEARHMDRTMRVGWILLAVLVCLNIACDCYEKWQGAKGKQVLIYFYSL